MNSDDIIWRLAQLASLPFQERYIINGSKEEYVLSTELLENLDGIKYSIDRSKSSELNDEQVEVLQQLFAYIDAHSGDALDVGSSEEGATLIRSGEVWKELRAKAGAALEAFGFSSEMSVEEVNRLSE